MPSLVLFAKQTLSLRTSLTSHQTHDTHDSVAKHSGSMLSVSFRSQGAWRRNSPRNDFRPFRMEGSVAFWCIVERGKKFINAKRYDFALWWRVVRCSICDGRRYHVHIWRW